MFGRYMVIDAVVYQVLNLKVSHHYAKMIRLCFIRSLYPIDLFVSKAGFASERLMYYTAIEGRPPPRRARGKTR